MASFLDELSWRGLLYQKTAEENLEAHIASGPRRAYCGFDPTADSLTIGNLVPLQMLAHWQRAGHVPIVVAGGATGLIGDPSGKDQERPLLSREEVAANISGQRRIFERLLSFDAAMSNRARLVDNAAWLGSIGFVDFLRDVGKHFSVNTMIHKESIRERLHGRDRGISYTEFSYILLQAYDFLHLNRTLGCTVQMAGSDQYGNIVAGIDLIHRTLGSGVEAFGITAPLITHCDGRKIGKTAGGAIWLTSDRTSVYAFYQHWINVPDADAAGFLRWFTVLDRAEIEGILAVHGTSPHERVAQRALARHLTDRVHGESERRRVEAASEALFGGGDLRSLDAATLAEVTAEIPHSDHARAQLDGEGWALVDLLPETSLANSKREAREFLATGAVAVNGERAPKDRRLKHRDLLTGGITLLRKGKKSWHALRWV